MKQVVTLIGIGPGDRAMMTYQAQEAALSCQLLFGAPRMLAAFPDSCAEKIPAIAPGEIAQRLQAAGPGQRAGVLVSGDVGFFSLAQSLAARLGPQAQIERVCGISSLSALCARMGASWEDVAIASAHGRDTPVAGTVLSHAKTFILTGGQRRVQHICRELDDCGLGGCRVTVGENLSYPDERLVTATAGQLAGQEFDSLAVMLVENGRPLGGGSPAPGLPDDCFIRGKVPMTKAEVRAVCLSKLRPAPGEVLYDIGAGTGSVSVEMALMDLTGRVFAVEKAPEALGLIRQNREKFGVYHLQLVPGEAPGCLAGLPPPDAAFIGGSGGQMQEILAALLQKNPRVRVVASAIALESSARILQAMQQLGFSEPEVVQLFVARGRRAGGLHLMMGQNPVTVISAHGQGGDI